MVAFLRSNRNPATLLTDCWLEGREIPAKEFQESSHQFAFGTGFQHVLLLALVKPFCITQVQSAAATYGRPMQSNESSVTCPSSK
jgi:hypothetical protein